MGQADALPAVLVAGYLGDNLSGDIAGRGKAVGLLNPGFADNRAVLQHVLQVHQVAVVHVLGKIIGVMEMDDALLVSLHDVLGKEHPLGQVLADLPGHVIPLHTVDRWILVGILLLHILIIALNQGQNAVIRCIGLAYKGALIAVSHIILCKLKCACRHDLVLHHILDLLNGHSPVKLYTLVLHIIRNVLNLLQTQLVFSGSRIGLCHSHHDLIVVKILFRAIPLNNLHRHYTPFIQMLSHAACLQVNGLKASYHRILEKSVACATV